MRGTDEMTATIEGATGVTRASGVHSAGWLLVLITAALGALLVCVPRTESGNR
jgi:hypothetical protein